MNYEFIDNVKSKIPINTTKRMDCPECGSHNSLSVTNYGTQVKFNCFDASCNYKGYAIGLIDNPEEYKKYMKDRDKGTTIINWEVPDYFRYNSNQIYDTKQDRDIYLVYNDHGKCVGAHGRKRNWNKTLKVPKWYKYGDTSWPYSPQFHNTFDIGIIVEDCLSANAIDAAGILCQGIALGGTELPANSLKTLKYYSKLWICLDRDASIKAFKLAQDLRSHGIKEVKIKLLEKDIKYLSSEHIRVLFKY